MKVLSWGCGEGSALCLLVVYARSESLMLPTFLFSLGFHHLVMILLCFLVPLQCLFLPFWCLCSWDAHGQLRPSPAYPALLVRLSPDSLQLLIAFAASL